MTKKISKTLCLVGNPNVGKSTVFNALTGMNQHTGNWPGKTVSNASGEYNYKNEHYKIYDLPGIYSLLPKTEEELVARDFICFEEYDGVVLVCDALCLMRNLNLVLQVLEITSNVIVCINLLDEAKKNNIEINIDKLSDLLGVKVIGITAREKIGMDELLENISELKEGRKRNILRYPKIEEEISLLEDALDGEIEDINKIRWAAINVLKDDRTVLKSLNIKNDRLIENSIIQVKRSLLEKDILINEIEDYTVEVINNKAEDISNKVVMNTSDKRSDKNRKIDKIVTSKVFGIPLMLLMLVVIFFITITLSNYPSELLFNLFRFIEDHLFNILSQLLPDRLCDMLVFGLYRTLTWVVSVMLPPMAIFFPLFTILEDLGYLPRIAFNVDKAFRKCDTCGKQALTMCMGFGCNAVGVSGTRIIDSKRERLIAIITNSFVPCNGRFPTIIAIISMFIVGISNSLTHSILSAFVLTLVILLGITMTFIVSLFLSKTFLKGEPSSFILELPPYRKPKFLSVIVRSLLDRSLFVLGRAVTVAIPAGIIIWCMANITLENKSILLHCSDFLDPFASLFGMDGVILLAFILGFPANEIVIPIIIMSYLRLGSMTDLSDLVALKELLTNNGWTIMTAISVIIFSLIHFPCSTTCMTIKKETSSLKWTLLAILIPTICGFSICFIINFLYRLLI